MEIDINMTIKNTFENGSFKPVSAFFSYIEAFIFYWARRPEYQDKNPNL